MALTITRNAAVINQLASKQDIRPVEVMHEAVGERVRMPDVLTPEQQTFSKHLLR